MFEFTIPYLGSFNLLDLFSWIQPYRVWIEVGMYLAFIGSLVDLAQRFFSIPRPSSGSADGFSVDDAFGRVADKMEELF